MLTQNVSQNRDGNNEPIPLYLYANITSKTTTLVKSGQGYLHSITINNPIATGTIEIDDALTHTNPFGTITIPASPQPITLIYDVIFNTGLTIVTGVENMDITVSYN